MQGSGFVVGVRLRNASSAIIANATIGGAANTSAWFSGATITANFSAANLTLAANTTYRWEVFETTASQTLGLLNLSPNTPDIYTLGNGFSGAGVTSSNRDWYGWSVNVQGILPLQWLSVTGNYNTQQKATINWRVQEIQVNNYQVESSDNGNLFTTIAQIASKGNGDNNYSYTDVNTAQATHFYRVKQIDADGRFSYSPIIRLSKTANASLQLYQNPVRALATISGATIGSKMLLTDAIGKPLQAIDITQPTFTINFSSYPNGIYFLKTKDGTALKVIKQQ